MIKSIPLGRLNQSKMNCIKDIINSKLFKLPECREILLPVFCRQIRDKLDKKEEVCCIVYSSLTCVSQCMFLTNYFSQAKSIDFLHKSLYFDNRIKLYRIARISESFSVIYKSCFCQLYVQFVYVSFSITRKFHTIVFFLCK